MLNDEIILHLPFPPTVNSYYKHSKFGVHISKKGRLFRESLEDTIREQVRGIKLDETLFVEVYLYPPDRRKRDLDNYMKALLDALTQYGLWEDDSLINQLHIFRGEVIKGGAVIMKISPSAPVYPFKGKYSPIDTAEAS